MAVWSAVCLCELAGASDLWLAVAVILQYSASQRALTAKASVWKIHSVPVTRVSNALLLLFFIYFCSELCPCSFTSLACCCVWQTTNDWRLGNYPFYRDTILLFLCLQPKYIIMREKKYTGERHSCSVKFYLWSALTKFLFNPSTTHSTQAISCVLLCRGKKKWNKRDKADGEWEDLSEMTTFFFPAVLWWFVR